MIDTLADAWDTVIIDIPETLLSIIDFEIISLAGVMVGFGFNVSTGARVIVLIFAFIALYVVVSVSYPRDLRAAVMIVVLMDAVIGDAPRIDVDVSADDAKIEVATMTALEWIPALALSEEALPLAWEACSCSPTAIRNCRALQL